MRGSPRRPLQTWRKNSSDSETLSPDPSAYCPVKTFSTWRPSRDTDQFSTIAIVAQSSLVFFVWGGGAHNHGTICYEMGYRTDVPV